MSELKAWTAQEIANSEKNFLTPPIKDIKFISTATEKENKCKR